MVGKVVENVMVVLMRLVQSRSGCPTCPYIFIQRLLLEIVSFTWLSMSIN